MIAAEQVRLLDAKELSVTYAYSAPETEEIQAGGGFVCLFVHVYANVNVFIYIYI